MIYIPILQELLAQEKKNKQSAANDEVDLDELMDVSFFFFCCLLANKVLYVKDRYLIVGYILGSRTGEVACGQDSCAQGLLGTLFTFVNFMHLRIYFLDFGRIFSI